MENYNQHLQPVVDLLHKRRMDPDYQLTDQELSLLDQWANLSPENRDLVDGVMQGRISAADDLDKAMMFNRIEVSLLEKIQHSSRIRRQRFWIFRATAAAAIIFGFMAVGWWKLMEPAGPEKRQQSAANSREAIHPTLTLPDGKTIDLLPTDSLIDLHDAGTATTRGNQLTYQGGTAVAEVQYNTLRVPKGRSYKVRLPDQSVVWLNAATTLIFPTYFERERTVQLAGEGYFEIAKDEHRPFKVTVVAASRSPLEIIVLGTRFNVSAYDDLPASRTTLIEGKVRISAAQQSSVLSPGEQAILQQGQLAVARVSDAGSVTAWKDGMFHFREQPLDEVLATLSRWYDLDVEFAPDAKRSLPFSADLPVTTPLADIVTVLKGGGADLTLHGKRIIVK